MSVAEEYTASIFRVLYPEDGDSRALVFQKINNDRKFKKDKDGMPFRGTIFHSNILLGSKIIGKVCRYDGFKQAVVSSK
jgi:hypothetical protein